MAFTSEQLSVINHAGGHAKCVAVAGSGKTHTLIGLVEKKIAEGINAARIAVIMFNKLAAVEFSERLQSHLGSTAVNVRTFNSFGEGLTRRFQEFGWLPEYELETREYVLESIAQKVLAKALATAYPTEEENESFLSYIAFCKASLLPPEEVYADSGIFKNKAFITAFEAFEKERKRRRIRTFDDQVWQVVKVICANPRAGEYVANRFDLILVDEFQDANFLQLELLRQLAGDRAQTIVVGDADQAIYEFRGASPQIIREEFDLCFRQADTYCLPHTFRYGHRLSLFANHVIRNNRNRAGTLCISAANNPDTRISLFSADRQVREIVKLAKDLMQHNSGESFAVLFRIKAQATLLTLALLTNKIAFELKNIPFILEDRYISGLLALLHYAQGTLFTDEQADKLACLMALHPAGVSKADLDSTAAQAVRQKSLKPFFSLAETIKKDYPRKLFIKRLKLIESFSGSRLKAHVLLNHFIQESELFETIESLSATSTHAEEKKLIILGIVDYFRLYELAAGDALEHVQTMFSQFAKQNQGGIVVTTAHAAKGLEWDHVVLAGLEEGYFPYTRKKDSVDIEAERRLFYVSVTRAKQHLYLFCPKDEKLLQTVKDGSCLHPDVNYIAASRFLYEGNLGISEKLGGAIYKNDSNQIKKLVTDDSSVADSYLQNIGLSLSVKQKQSAPHLQSVNVPAGQYREGSIVNHAKFGRGTVTGLRAGHFAKIRFENKHSEFDMDIAPCEVVRF